MDLFSPIFGADNLRKLAFFLGAALMVFGIIYPIQQRFELEQKKIEIGETRSLISVSIENMQQKFGNIDVVVKNNSNALINLEHERDSILNLKHLTPQNELKVSILTAEINQIEDQEFVMMNDANSLAFEIDKALVKSKALEDEVKHLNDFIEEYSIIRWVVVAFGGLIFILGLIGWKKSQNNSDTLVKQEIERNSLEIEKIKTENS
jgi:hypothetical protein